MNSKIPKALKSVRALMEHEKGNVEMRASKAMDAKKEITSRHRSMRERKMALLQDVDKLRKKLRHEENVQRALKRASKRPLGALPRLPPYLPPCMLELLAEVAVLEEEVVQLEEQVVHFRQGLYQEAVYISSSKQNVENSAGLYSQFTMRKLKQKRSRDGTLGNAGVPITRHSLPLPDDGLGKENQSFSSSTKINEHSLNQKSGAVRALANEDELAAKHLSPQKLQPKCRVIPHGSTEARVPLIRDEKTSVEDCPNKISESLLKCLSRIFLRMSTLKSGCTADISPSLLALASHESSEESMYRDPYGICSLFGKRDIGPYKHLLTIEACSINPPPKSDSSILVRRLKLLLGKLASVDLEGLNHQEKLAFWINIYNSCMMNAFLEYGTPASPEMVVALMQKAIINVGGYLLNAITIEHFILRLPYHLKYTFSKGSKSAEIAARTVFGLELTEPLVTFALCCGSWSSPAVRVYTASHVENELEVAKKEYLQAAVGISTTNFAIPKLLDWYLFDFAKDLESLLDWICLQLPNELGKQAIKCLERGKTESPSQFLQIIPYEFRVRYLLHV